jgi:hypothetical protein
MKKQLFLFMFLLAFFAGIFQANAQCVPTPLSPAAGIAYTYSATISGPGYNGTNTPLWDWYVTKDVNLLTAGSIITLPSTMFSVDVTTPYHNPATGVGQVIITWTPAAVADGGPFYLVLRYRENNSLSTPTCSAENIKVWQINPINTFLLAFEGGMLNAGSYVPTPGSNACAANVVGATVTPGTPGTATLVYGQNTIYYVATASGILGNWKPWIQVPALQTSQVYVSAQWSADMTGGAVVWNDFGVAATGAMQTLQSLSGDATILDAVAGTPILIRIVIDNQNWQTLAAQPILVGLDGFLPTAYTVSDIVGTGGTPCAPETPFGRTATYTINARPTITGNPPTLILTNP